ncbi:MAG: endopeptidase La [Bacteroidaceae bacterium]|nr:endopeptidase La [Bacteroidaceae bacterium]
MPDEHIPSPFSFLADFDGDDKSIFDIELPATIPVIPLRDSVLFPGVIQPLPIGRKSSIRLAQRACNNNTFIAVVTQLKPEQDLPTPADMHPVGVAARVLRVYEMPDDTCMVLMQGLSAIEIDSMADNGDHLVATAHIREELLDEMHNRTYSILSQTIRDRLIEFAQLNGMPQTTPTEIRNASMMRFFVNFVCCTMPIEGKTKMKLLMEKSPVERATNLMRIISRELQFAHIRNDIQQKTQVDLNKQQREYYLQQQLRNIQDQLGEHSGNDIEELQQKSKKKKWNENVAKQFNHELDKLRRLNQQSPDYQVQYNYLETMLQLPWGEMTKDKLNLKNAERVLNRDHYGMKEVKERILEHLAVMHMNGGKKKSTIICLYGPPGVGKTSLCRSIATALNRKYVRASLGGLHDEAEIRGHRRTYIGAMPGRIIKDLIKAGASNPVFVLDEIDKVTEHTHNGDPASALLEVLDPEQNASFHDNFLEVDYDLSNVMFIATANNVGTIPRPLLDRMELIEVNGYITEEKIEIAKRHLIPRVKENCGLQSNNELKFTPAALEYVIENYTRESGVRGLEKELERFFRKTVLFYERESVFPATRIGINEVKQMLGKPKYMRDTYQGNDFAGVVTGLAWTSVGGEILFIETSLSRGKGQKLTLTGNLGDVMKESAVLALEFIKAHAERLNIDMRIFDNYNLHVHVPEGAVPKDGPSAGITMTTSMVSALKQCKVRPNLAMTGEITLRGKVLPVGGIKEKILAAKRAGITDIILCQDNRKDIDDIDQIYLKGLTFHYVSTIFDVLEFALLDETVNSPIHFDLSEKKDD